MVGKGRARQGLANSPGPAHAKLPETGVILPLASNQRAVAHEAGNKMRGYAEINLGLGSRGYIVRWSLVPDARGYDPVEVELGCQRKIRAHVRRLSYGQAKDLLSSVWSDSARGICDLLEDAGRAWYHHEQAISEMASLMGHGTYLLLEPEVDAHGWANLRASPPRNPRDEPREPLTKIPREGTTALHVQVLLDDGARLKGAKIALAAPDGQAAELVANHRGEAALDKVAADGVGRAVVRPTKTPRWRSGTESFHQSERTFDFPFETPVSADVPTGTMYQLILRRPEVERVEDVGLGFALDSPLLVPLDDHLSPTPALATALARLRDVPSLRLLIVGHASPDGNTKLNDDLARRRAECARHLLVGDRDAWVDLATNHGGPADIQKLLRYLAHVHDWATDPERTDGVMDARVKAAVSAFQTTYNAVFEAQILVDGVIGVETLGALFDVQRHELRHHLDALDVADTPPRWFGATGAAGAGARILAHPGIPGSESDAGQRRIDLLLLDDTLGWGEAHGLDLLYDVARFRVVPIAPLPMGRSDLVVQVVDHYGRILAGEPYRVTTDEEEREGVSDEQGMVVERGLHGRFARLECGSAVVVLDDPYFQTARQRYVRVAPTDLGDDDEPWSDEPLPALNDDDDDDDLDDADDLDDEDEDEEG